MTTTEQKVTGERGDLLETLSKHRYVLRPGRAGPPVGCSCT